MTIIVNSMILKNGWLAGDIQGLLGFAIEDTTDSIDVSGCGGCGGGRCGGCGGCGG